MNQHIDDPVTAFDDPALEREWLLQERAMRRERLHSDSGSDDPCDLRYRLIARVLREPPAAVLPVDFARQMAIQVAGQPARYATAAASFERGLILVLASVLATTAGVVVVAYGSTWLPSFAAIVPTPDAATSRWLLTLAGCLGASWLLGLWQHHAHGR